MTVLHHLRFSARLAARRRAFTAVTIAILALGIGANTAVFSIVKAVLFETLPFDRAEDLVYLRENTAEIPTMWVAWQNYLDWRERNRVFQSLGASRVRQTLLGGGDGRRPWDEPLRTRKTDPEDRRWWCWRTPRGSSASVGART